MHRCCHQRQILFVFNSDFLRSSKPLSNFSDNMWRFWKKSFDTIKIGIFMIIMQLFKDSIQFQLTIDKNIHKILTTTKIGFYARLFHFLFEKWNGITENFSFSCSAKNDIIVFMWEKITQLFWHIFHSIPYIIRKKNSKYLSSVSH